MESHKTKWVISFFVLTLITVTVSPDFIWAEISKGSEISCRPRPRSLYGYPGDYGFAGTPLVGSGYYDKPWVVYADREGTPVFRDEACRNQTGMKLRFLEPLFVVGVRKDKGALELVRARWPWAKLDIEVNEYIGWVKVDDLLLLMNALQHERTLIFKKCFVLNEWQRFASGTNLDHLKADEVDLGPVVVRSGPGEEFGTVKSLHGVNLFFFSFKTVEQRGQKWFLIGKQKNIIPGNEKDYLLGWIKGDRVVEWDTREALEPHPDRKSPAHIYATASDLLNDGPPLLRDTMFREAWPPERWRYLVLDSGRQGNTEYARIGWFGPLITDQGVFQISDDPTADPIADAARFHRWAMEFRDSQQTVNLIFVVDATRGMEPYLERTGDIVGAVMDKHRGKVRFGAVVYRDFADGPECTDMLPLRRDAYEVTQFLRDAAKAPSHLHDRDFEEALYQGLKIALRDVAEAGKNNTVILIGDAGNNFAKDSTTASEIADLAYEKYAQIHAVRIVRPPVDPAEAGPMDRFRVDIQGVFDALTARVRSEEVANDSGGFLDRTSYIEVPHQEASGKAGEAILDRIEEVFRRQRQMLDALASMTGSWSGSWIEEEGSSSVVSAKLRRAMKRYFEAKTGDAALADRMIGVLISDSKIQVLQPGFVRLRDEAGNPLMRKVILLSMEDLANLTRVLDELTSIVDKKDLVRAWKEMIVAELGTIPDSPEQYVQMRTGMAPKELHAFLSRSWDQLRKVTDDDLMDFIRKANNIKEALRELLNSPEQFRNFDIRYAWVPVEKIP